MTTAFLTYRGSDAVSTRLSLDTVGINGFGSMTLVDFWRIWSAPRDGTSQRLYEFRVWRDTVTRTVYMLLCDGLRDGEQAGTRELKPYAMFRFPEREVREDADARELARHLTRNLADGRIPLPPKGELDTARWEGAIGAALAFIERFGIAPGAAV